ncbi:hypothetical protein J1G42_09015 [Cellulomonas sp. zg-ZUI222]|uniref:hypothetical protein n=1 Tax=Cellulomonas wangleii TaxID=2816956 RepID=UPI001A94BD39|nr:hypothetical protein [Cellulomonas wangleii]MBO0920965.1 hypothetical protein [Cellulomonas wangleii]
MDARPEDDPGADDSAGAEHPRDVPAGPPHDDRPRADDPADGVATDDEVWASLVARLSDVDAAPEPPTRGRVLRAAPEEPSAAVGPPEAPGPAATAPGPAPLGARDWDGTTQYDAAEDAVDDIEHFVPQDPGPVLGGNPLLTLAWGAAIGSPLFLLVVVVAWQDAPALLVRAAAALFVLAVAILVWRMPQRREPTDGDGAVV